MSDTAISPGVGTIVVRSNAGTEPGVGAIVATGNAPINARAILVGQGSIVATGQANSDYMWANVADASTTWTVVPG